MKQRAHGRSARVETRLKPCAGMECGGVSPTIHCPHTCYKKLRGTCRTIESREGVKKHEQTRINDALQLVATSSAPSGSKTAERQESYQHFLKRVEKLCGLEMVALCAIGLGKTAIAGM